MAIQLLNLGAAPNDGNGDNLRVAGQKINDNFQELYTGSSSGSNPGGSNNQIQFNDSGFFSGSNNFTFDKIINKVTLTGSFDVSGSVTIIDRNTTLNLVTSVSSTPLYINAQGSSTVAIEMASQAIRRFRILATSVVTTFESTNTQGFLFNSTGSFKSGLIVTGSMNFSGSASVRINGFEKYSITDSATYFKTNGYGTVDWAVGAITSGETGTMEWHIGANHGFIWSANNYANVMILDKDGQLGLGLARGTKPSAKFHLSGSGQITGSLNVSGSVNISAGNNSGSAIIGVGLVKITVGTQQPPSPNIGDLWIDTN